MANTIKAAKAEVPIGDLVVDGLMLPDTSYCMSESDACRAIDEPLNSFSHFLKSNYFKSLLEAGSAFSEKPSKIGIEGNNVKVVPRPLEHVRLYWLAKASTNPKALILCNALMAETLERRFDRAFGRKVEEEEYDRKLAERMKGKVVRRSFTDALMDYKERHPELSDNDKHWMYSNATDLVNLAVFGRKAKQLVEDFGASREKLRDWMNPDELRWVYEIEELAKRLVDQMDMHPCDAVKEAKNRLIIPVVKRIAS